MASPRPLPLPRLHVVTDDRPGRDPLRVVDAALTAGARCVQVRLKAVTDRAHHVLAATIAERCRTAGAVCIVNDRADIALAAGATGVHLGADDLPVAAARRVLGDGLLVGGTARDPETARRLVAEGADYLGVGPVHRTTTKDGLPEPIGLAGLAAVAEAVDVPVIAIAGITAERVPDVLAAGAYGVAVIGAVSDAPDPAAATRHLLDAVGADDGPGG